MYRMQVTNFSNEKFDSFGNCEEGGCPSTREDVKKGKDFKNVKLELKEKLNVK